MHGLDACNGPLCGLLQIKESDGLGGYLVFVELLREGSRREIAKSRLFADAVINVLIET